MVNLHAARCYFVANGDHPVLAEGRSFLCKFLTEDLTTASPLMMVATFPFPLHAIRQRRRGQPLPDALCEGFPRNGTLFLV
jgi:hypothetical protein